MNRQNRTFAVGVTGEKRFQFRCFQVALEPDEVLFELDPARIIALEELGHFFQIGEFAVQPLPVFNLALDARDVLCYGLGFLRLRPEIRCLALDNQSLEFLLFFVQLKENLPVPSGAGQALRSHSQYPPF